MGSTAAPLYARLGLEVRPQGASGNLAVAVGTALDDANRTGWYDNLSILGSEVLGTVVGGTEVFKCHNDLVDTTIESIGSIKAAKHINIGTTALAHTPVAGDIRFNGTNFEGYNGSAWVSMEGEPAGANTEIQFNNSGNFGASSNLTWDGTYIYSLAGSFGSAKLTGSLVNLQGAASDGNLIQGYRSDANGGGFKVSVASAKPAVYLTDNTLTNIAHIGTTAISGGDLCIALGSGAPTSATAGIAILASTQSVQLNSTEAATATTNGALRVAGGVGVTGSFYLGTRSGTATTVAGFDANGKLIDTTVAPGAASLTATYVGYGSGSNLLTGSANLTYADTLGTGGLTIANTTASTSATTGALIVGGGMGVSGAVNITVPNVAGTREAILNGRVASTGNGVFGIANGTLTDNSFFPTFLGYIDYTSSAPSLKFNGMVSPANDATEGSTNGILNFQVMRTDSPTDPNNGNQTTIQNRRLYGWLNLSTLVLYIQASGQVNIPTNIAATSSTSGVLVVSGGVGVAGALYTAGLGNFGSASDISFTGSGLGAANLRAGQSISLAVTRAAVYGRADGTASLGTPIGVMGYSTNSGTFSGSLRGVHAKAEFTGNGQAGLNICTGLIADASSTTTIASAQVRGADITSSASGASNAATVYGAVITATGAATSPTVYGVHTTVSGGTAAWAGYFVGGRVHVHMHGNSPNTAVTGTATTLSSISAQDTDNAVLATAYGTGSPSFNGCKARGPSGFAPAAVQAGDALVSLRGWGYGATVFSTAARVSVTGTATETWTDAANGTRLSVSTTVPTTILTTEKMRIWGDGGTTIGDIFRAPTGTISSTGTAVTGVGTNFTKCLRPGDSITASAQTRIVLAVFSDTSLSTTVAFSPTLAGASFTVTAASPGVSSLFVSGVVNINGCTLTSLQFPGQRVLTLVGGPGELSTIKGLPGTGGIGSSFEFAALPDGSNTGRFLCVANTAAVYLASDRSGTGALLPMAFRVGNDWSLANNSILVGTNGYVAFNTGTPTPTNPTHPLQYGGNAAIKWHITTGGDTVISSNTASTSSTTGSLTTAGGVGITGSVYAAGTTNNFGSSSTISIAFNVAGGVATPANVGLRAVSTDTDFTTSAAIFGRASSGSGNGRDKIGVIGLATHNGSSRRSDNTIGVYGRAEVQATGLTAVAVGVEAYATSATTLNTNTVFGVRSAAVASGGATAPDVYGGSFSATGAASSVTSYGIYATASGAVTNWAGYFAGNVATTGTITLYGATSGSATIQVAAVAGTPATLFLPIDSGSPGDVLSTNGAGTLSWVAQSTTSPGGADTYIQFNDGGSTFGGDAAFVFDKTTEQVTISNTKGIPLTLATTVDSVNDRQALSFATVMDTDQGPGTPTNVGGITGTVTINHATAAPTFVDGIYLVVDVQAGININQVRAINCYASTAAGTSATTLTGVLAGAANTGGTVGTCYGIYAQASGGTTNWAGYFDGRVNVDGTDPATITSGKVAIGGGLVHAYNRIKSSGLTINRNDGAFAAGSIYGSAINGLVVAGIGGGTYENMLTTSGGSTIYTTSSTSIWFRGTVAAPYFSLRDGYDIYEETTNADNGMVRISWYGYLGGATKFRNTIIGDGKGAALLTVTGSTASATFTGDFSINSGTLYVAEFVRVATSVVSASTTIATGRVKFTGSTASQTLTLPAGLDGMDVYIRNASSVSVTIARAGSDTIEGATSLVVPAGESVLLTFCSTGTDWTSF